MQVAVLGLGRFGSKVAEVLTARGGEVIAIDRDPEVCDDIKDRVTQAVALDTTDERSLRALGIQDVDVAVVGIGSNVEASIMTTALLRRLGVRRIIARAIGSLQGEILREVGASQVLYLEDQMGEQVAMAIAAPQILERITLGTGHTLAEVQIPPQYVGKTLQEMNLRGRHGLNVIAIKRRVPAVTEDGQSTYEEKVNDLPGANDRVEEEDVLVVVGSKARVDELFRDLEDRD